MEKKMKTIVVEEPKAPEVEVNGETMNQKYERLVTMQGSVDAKTKAKRRAMSKIQKASRKANR